MESRGGEGEREKRIRSVGREEEERRAHLVAWIAELPVDQPAATHNVDHRRTSAERSPVFSFA